MSLDQIAIRCGTDKSSKHHGYTKYYEQYFDYYRNKPVTLLELGHGGYSYYDRGGESARTWREYFHQGKIVSIDIYDKQPIEGVEFYKGSQDDPEFLNNLIEQIGRPDIIIDDGCHRSPESIRSFKILFPLLKNGGIYCWEDLEASYWKVASDGQDFKGGIDNPNSSMNFLKSLTDEINSGHSGLENRYDITSMHFYKKIVFIFR